MHHMPHSAAEVAQRAEKTSLHWLSRLLGVMSTTDLKPDFMGKSNRHKRQLQPAQRLSQHLRQNVVACRLAANDSCVLTKEAWQCLFNVPNSSSKPAHLSP